MITLLLVCLIGCSPDIEYEPYRDTYWGDIPRVVICPDNPVPISRLEEAFREWEEIDPKYHTDRFYEASCDGEKFEGEIWITRFNPNIMPSIDASAYTISWNYSNAKCKRYASSIFLKPINGKEIIKHEIGHAFGWQHVDKKGHLMSPKMYMGLYGYSEEGLSDIDSLYCDSGSW